MVPLLIKAAFRGVALFWGMDCAYLTKYGIQYVSDFVLFWNQKSLLITLLVKTCGPVFIKTFYKSPGSSCVKAFLYRLENFCFKSPLLFVSIKVSTSITHMCKLWTFMEIYSNFVTTWYLSLQNEYLVYVESFYGTFVMKIPISKKSCTLFFPALHPNLFTHGDC